MINRVAIVFDNLHRPETTGTYCRRALGKLVDCDHFLPEELKSVDPDDYDLFLYVDDGLTRSFSRHHRPSAWWAIDTHLHRELYVALAEHVDFVFCAQKVGVEAMRNLGIQAIWLPLACDEEIHKTTSKSKSLDFSFVGNIFPGPREDLLINLQREFPSHYVGRRYFNEMADLYAQSRVVFNRSIDGDLNMRVFEALASGSLLVTDALPKESGLYDLFVPDEHFLTYTNEHKLLEQVHWALDFADERERIATNGQEEVLSKHTYCHRMATLLNAIKTRLRPPLGQSPHLDKSPKEPLLDKSSDYFEHQRPEVLALVPKNAKNILDLGCGGGRLGEALKQRQDCQVTGVEMNPIAAERAQVRLDVVHVNSVDSDALSFKNGSFDCVVCADILEHVRRPEHLVARIRSWLCDGGSLVISMPNVRHHSVIRSLLDGNWTYESAGLLDEDHVRFFTRRELEKLLFRAGFQIEEWQVAPGAGYLEWANQGRPCSVSVGGLSYVARDEQDAEELFAYQFLTRVKSVPQIVYGLTSIVLVTYGQLDYTRMCLESIRRFTDEPYELIVVDNNSPDLTREYLQGQTDVHLIENEVNRGFPAAANQGMSVAKGEQVLLLNNDTIVTTGWLRRMLDALHMRSSVGLVGPVSNSVSGPQQIDVSYDELSQLDGFAWDWSKRNLNNAVACDRLVGFCLLFRREVMDAIGMLDERFGIGNFEDDDFCRRALEHGFEAVIAKNAFVHHFGGTTFIASGVDYGQLLAENQRKYAEKWSSEDNDLATNRSSQRPESEVKISLCMIVRDNEHTIRPCLESIRPWVDEMIVVDTGSVDSTAEICAELGAKVFEFPWCDDFSAARNESLRFAQGEWVFWMDSDDTISESNGRKLRKIAYGEHRKDVHGYVMQVHCPGESSHDVTAVDHIKLFRNRDDLRFEFRIHEQILPSIRRAGGEVEFTDVFVTHSGADRSYEGKQKKLIRDLRILDSDLAERPNHPFVLFNLGMTYADAHQYQDAARFLERSIQNSAPDESHVRKAYALLIGAFIELKDFHNAEKVLDSAMEIFPLDVELQFRSGMIHQHFGRLEDAREVYTSILQGHQARHFSSVDQGLAGYKTRHNLALVLEDLACWREAENEWRAILRELPRYRTAWRALGEILIFQRRWPELNKILLEIADAPELLSESAILQARKAEVDGDIESARQILWDASNTKNAGLEPLQELCRLLFTNSHTEEAIAALEELTKRKPDDAAAHHNLGVLRLRSGDRQAAIHCFRESLRLRPAAPHTQAELDAILRETSNP